MDAYPNESGHRLRPSDIADYITQRTGCSVVAGLEEMVDAGGATPGGPRIAGFMETHKLDEWYLPLTAQRPMTWRTAPVPERPLERVAFWLPMGLGNGSPLPQPSGQWNLYCNDRLAVSFRVVKHSQLWRGDESALAFAANRIESAEPFGSLCLSSVITDESFAAFGPALLTVPAAWLEPGKRAVLRVEAQCDVESTRWFQLATAPGLLDQCDVYRAADLLTDARVPEVDGYNVYFGDIHTHSGEVDGQEGNKGCGMGTRASNYAYAHGPGGLDFYALTDHEFQIDRGGIDAYLALADAYNDDGRLVCLPAYEFTSPMYGHRNVYFGASGGTVVNNAKDWGRPAREPENATTPPELWAALEATGAPFITVPHHPSAASHPLTWDYFNPRYDRLAEVYSVWGSSAYYGDFPRGVSDRYRSLHIRDGLNRGHRFGLIASADGHDGHPGNAQSPLVKHHHQFHHLGSGRAAVLAKELTRESVFEALHARRCYATTGVPIALSFSVNSAVMGSELHATGAAPRVRVSCTGANGIDHIRIVRNGRVVLTQRCHGEFTYTLDWTDDGHDATAPAWYYARVVQVDRESAWSSPIWIG